MKISIVGAAGNVGSSAAFNIGIHNLADELVMVDNYSADKLEHYVTDLATSVTGMDIVVRGGGYEDMRGSDIVLVSAGSSKVGTSRMGLLPLNLPVFQDIAGKIKQFCPESVIITATNPVCPLNYAMYLATGFERQKVIGYTANDSIRFRLFLARALGIKSSQVEATVIGEHGGSQVLLFSSVRVNGKPFPVNDDIRQEVRGKADNTLKVIEAQRLKTGRTQGWTTSMGLTEICRAISKNTLRLIPCSLVLDGEYGYRGVSISVPAVIRREGVQEIQEWELEPEERNLLEVSVNTLRPAMNYVEEFMGVKIKEQ
jgi:malate dehydrogenase